MDTSSTSPASPELRASSPTSPRGRLVIDAPMRAFHWLFALSFAGAWLTAESERWRDLHVTLGYAFGGLLVFRLAYGLLGPRPARLSLLWHRAAGWGSWLSQVRAGRLDAVRTATLAMGVAMVLLLALAAPLVLTGFAGYVDAFGLEDAFQEVHEALANTAMSLVLAHLALIVGLSWLRRRNVAGPMLTGRMPGAGADVVKANRRWLALVVVAAYAGFVGTQLAQPAADMAGASRGEHHGRHHDDD